MTVDAAKGITNPDDGAPQAPKAEQGTEPIPYEPEPHPALRYHGMRWVAPGAEGPRVLSWDIGRGHWVEIIQ